MDFTGYTAWEIDAYRRKQKENKAKFLAKLLCARMNKREDILKSGKTWNVDSYGNVVRSDREMRYKFQKNTARKEVMSGAGWIRAATFTFKELMEVLDTRK